MSDKEKAGPGRPTGYLSELESDVLLADGRVAEVRPILPTDLAALKTLHEQLSRDASYFRFFGARREVPLSELERWVNVDYADRSALVAFVDDELVAIASYDRVPESNEAEVAFTVRDDQQGRGIGTVLLEHLASAARGAGVVRFVADTLAENRRMLNVFRHAGFEEHAEFDSSVVRVVMELEAGESYADEVEERDRRAAVASIERLLCPGSVAVIGASRTPGTIGRELLANIVAGGFAGPIYPVNPAGGEISGLVAYKSMADVPGPVDLAVIVVPADQVADVIEECGGRGVGGLVVISSGFAETGATGRVAERELVSIARRHGMRLVGPNCMGIVNTAPGASLNATVSPVAPTRGRIGFSSQSGGLGIAILNEATHRDLGVSSFVSVGNKADVSGNDLLRYWEQDSETDVILLYLESFGNPRHFSRIARRIARKKPIIAVKSGRSPSGSRGASSHTAAAAIPDATVDALFRQAGVIRVDTLEELFDVADVLSHQPLPGGTRVAIVGNAGGPGVLAADACEGYGLSVPELSAPTQQRLRSLLGPAAVVGNPVDCVASATAEQYREALKIVLADDAIDSVIVIFTPPLVTQADDVADAVAFVTARATKTIVANFLATSGALSALREGERRVPWFAYPESAARALARIAPYVAWRARPVVAPPVFGDIDQARARLIVEAALRDSRAAWLGEEEASDLLGAYGLPLTPRARADGEEEIVETVVEVVQDPAFGPLVSFGLGDSANELLGERALSLVPLSRPEAVDLVSSLRSARLLTGYRGAERADVDALADVLCRVARLAEDLPEVVEMALDPVLAGPAGCLALGCRIRVETPAEPEPVLRRRHLR